MGLQSKEQKRRVVQQKKSIAGDLAWIIRDIETHTKNKLIISNRHALSAIESAEAFDTVNY